MLYAMQKKQARKLTPRVNKKTTRIKLYAILTREKFITASDLTASNFLTASDFKNWQYKNKNQKTRIFYNMSSRDYFKNQIENNTAGRVKNTNLKARQNLKAVFYNKKNTASDVKLLTAYFKNKRRQDLNIDGVKLQIDAPAYIDGVNITALYFKNNNARNNYILNNLTASQKKQYSKIIDGVKYKQRKNARKSKILTKIDVKTQLNGVKKLKFIDASDSPANYTIK